MELEPHVGDRVRLTRSGHSAGAAEGGTVVAILGRPGTQMLRIRWTENLETFVPADLVIAAARSEASRRGRHPATRHASRTPAA
jgi:hypothetical protein